MEFTVSKAVLESALSKLQSVIDNKTTIPILSSIKIASNGQAMDFTATNMETTVFSHLVSSQLVVVQEGELCVPAKRLFDIIRLMPDGPTKIANDENNWIKINGQGAKYRIPGPDASLFPETAPDHVRSDWVEVPAQVLKRLLTGVVFAINKQSTNRTLTGANLELNSSEVRMVATDGHRLAIASAPIDALLPNDAQLLITEEGTAELANLISDYDGPVGIAGTDKNLFFKAGGRVLATRRLAGTFPYYRSTVPEPSSTPASIPAAKFCEGLKRSLVLVSDEANHSVKLSITADGLSISANTKESGECSQEVPCQYNGKELILGVNVKYVLDFVGLFKGGNVILSVVDNGPLLLYPETLVDTVSYQYVLMPVRI